MMTRCSTVGATGSSGSSVRDPWPRKDAGADMRGKRTTRTVIWVRSVACTVALLASVALPAACTRSPVSPEDARAIAKEAYIYGFPLADSYRIQYAYFVNREDPEYKTPWNQIENTARVYTPDDRAIQTPNADTPYSWLGLDLRAEPIVLTVPPIEKGRYFSIQLIDLYTHNFDYIGSRTTGNDGGSFLVAGPGWKGDAPAGIKQVFQSETQLAMAVYRTQLFDPADIEKVKAIQAGYEVQPLSAFLGQPAPKAAPPIDFIQPLTRDELTKSPRIFQQVNFVLQFCPTHPSEQALMARLARLGIGAGQTFDISRFPPETREAIGQGIADAWADFAALKKRAESGEVGTADTFGTREHLKNNYLYRMAAAVLGIWGNSAEEAIYPTYHVDADGQALDGSHRYVLRFAPGELPPARSFWSLTMYELPESLLVANPNDRYLLNSTMLADFVRDPDGGITLYVQHDSPGKAREPNWLPAPEGPFVVVTRLYWPEPEALDGTWKQPPMMRVQ